MRKLNILLWAIGSLIGIFPWAYLTNDDVLGLYLIGFQFTGIVILIINHFLIRKYL